LPPPSAAAVIASQRLLRTLAELRYCQVRHLFAAYYAAITAIRHAAVLAAAVAAVISCLLAGLSVTFSRQLPLQPVQCCPLFVIVAAAKPVATAQNNQSANGANPSAAVANQLSGLIR
jgi:hypothetical protein